MLNAAFEAGIVLVREGLEALLVIAALSAYVARSGAGDQRRWVLGGAAAALAASLVAAWLFELFNNGAHDDLLEAATMIVAAALMLYMSGWLILRQDPRGWQAYLRQHADRALARGGAWTLAGIAFLAVFREGAETVLFLHGLAVVAGGWTAGILGGLAVGGAILVVLYAVIQRAAMRLPLRPLFLVSSAVLFVMALRFVGAAIQELQEQAILPVDDVPALPEWWGTVAMNASFEALVAQAAIVVGAALGALVMRRRAARAA